MVDIEAKKKEIADTHAAAQEAMQKMFEALDAFDKIQIIEGPDYDKEQEQELNELCASIFNRKVWFVKWFSSRCGGLLIM